MLITFISLNFVLFAWFINKFGVRNIMKGHAHSVVYVHVNNAFGKSNMNVYL